MLSATGRSVSTAVWGKPKGFATSEWQISVWTYSQQYEQSSKSDCCRSVPHRPHQLRAVGAV